MTSHARMDDGLLQMDLLNALERDETAPLELSNIVSQAEPKQADQAVAAGDDERAAVRQEGDVVGSRARGDLGDHRHEWLNMIGRSLSGLAHGCFIQQLLLAFCRCGVPT